MQSQIKVILVEDDIELCDEFKRCFDQTDGIELVATTDSASRALELVKELRPDAVILDLELHMGEGNGITFLSRLSKLNDVKKPYVVVNTNNSSQITYEIARKLGAGFVMYKHQQGHSPASVAEFLLNYAFGGAETAAGFNNPPADNTVRDTRGLRERIFNELNNVHISSKCKGYIYLADAIEIYCGGHMPNVAALVGEKHGTTAKSVERAMQNAIDRAWDKADTNVLLQYYKAYINTAKRYSPTVMEFIGYYAAQLRNSD